MSFLALLVAQWAIDAAKGRRRVQPQREHVGGLEARAQRIRMRDKVGEALAVPPAVAHAIGELGARAARFLMEYVLQALLVRYRAVLCKLARDRVDALAKLLKECELVHLQVRRQAERRRLGAAYRKRADALSSEAPKTTRLIASIL